MLNEEITIVFCTCDAFSELWDGFFKLLKKYWPDCKCKIILNTESIPFKYEGLNISEPLNCEKDTSWSLRLKKSLEKVETEKVLIFLDDFYLKSEVNTSIIEQCVIRMNEDSNLKSFVFAWQPGKNKNIDDGLFEERGRFAPYRINAQVALWNKDYLYEILRENESAWEYEVNGSFRSIFKKGTLLSLKKGVPLVFDYDFGFLIIRGKYNLDLIKYFYEKEQIEFNLNNREEFKPQNIVSNSNSIKRIKRVGTYALKAMLSIFKK